MTAGVVGTLILAGSANAAFTGLSVDLVDLGALGQDGFDGSVYQDEVANGLKVYRVYAEFDGADPLTDGVIAVFGDSIDSMSTTTSATGGFVNSAFGDNLAPNSAFLELPNFEALNWDTFVTIGALTDGTAQISPDFAANSSNLAGSHTLSNDAWFVPGDDENALAVDGRVLLAQFALIQNADDQPDLELRWNLQLVGGAQERNVVAASEPRNGDGGDIPAPGALALLGIAGAAGSRRRRR